MATPIILHIGSCVMFPIECKKDILELRMLTPVAPSLFEITDALMRQEQGKRGIIDQFETQDDL